MQLLIKFNEIQKIQALMSVVPSAFIGVVHVFKIAAPIKRTYSLTPIPNGKVERPLFYSFCFQKCYIFSELMTLL